LFPVLMVLLAFSSCYNDKADVLYPAPAGGCDTTNVTFTNSVLPVMLQSCALAGCHNSATASNGYVLETYNGIKSCVDAGRFMGSIHHQSGFIEMPQNAPQLNDCNLTKITIWVNAGAPNN